MAAVPYGPPVPLGHLLKGSKEIRQRIHRIGVELEGGWDILEPGVRIQRDGSVRADGHYVGELPSPPLVPGEPAEKWVKKYYPKYVNDSCGLHVHMSLDKALNYMRLGVPEYGGTVVACITDWAKQQKLPATHPIWPRLRDECRFCRHIFDFDAQVINQDKDFNQTREGNRYTAINYCYIRNHTVECRLLPMFESSEQGWEAVNEVVRITNAFLVATAKREKKAEAKVHDDPSSSQIYVYRSVI